MNAFAKVGAVGSHSGLKLDSLRWAGLKPGLRNLLLTALAAGVMTVLTPGVLLAANDAPAAQAAANSRAVRLSSVDGQVRVVQDGQIVADPATNNLPLFEGSEVSTGEDGRAEVQLENGSIARLSPNTTLLFTVLQQQGTSTHTEVVVTGGLAYLELQPSVAEHSLRVSYGPATFSATGFSVVRINMDQQPGTLAVFSGNVHLDRGDQLQLDIHGGESLSLDLSDLSRYNLAESITQDSWDSWNADRDQILNGQAAEKTAATGSFVNSDVAGMSDLDANGNWYNVPGQGYVWSPYDAQLVGASFDPYGYGNWVQYPGRGYLWTSGYDWGYAPFQCGLWNYYDNFGWGWAPGIGGCNPWWGYGGGGGGWGYNIGVAPRGYLPPRRPPMRPPTLPGHPHPLNGGRELKAGNIVPVDRRPTHTVNMASYVRPVQPVVIGGHMVEPLRPVTPRAVYDRPAAGVVAARQPGAYYPQPTHPVGAAPGSFVRSVPAGQAGSRPTQSYSYAPHPSSSSSYSGGHPSSMGGSAPASHPSFSGGGGGMSGGGGGHPSGGGGGGGGGGVHK